MRTTFPATAAALAALLLLAVSATAEPLCGDVNTSGTVTTSDALAVLQKSVGQQLVLQCELCPAGTTYGNTTDFFGSIVYAESFLQGSAYEIPIASTVTHLGMIAASSGQDVRLALYSDNAGEPADLVIGTSVFSLRTGAQAIEVPPTLVPAGTYWIMAMNTGSMDVRTDLASSGNIIKYRTLEFASALPEQFGPTFFVVGKESNFYVRVAP